MSNFFYRPVVSFLCYFALVVMISCSPAQRQDVNTKDPISTTNFPNILNLIGVPDSTTDRSVFAFSDLGAWHGYAIPSASDKSYAGSFIGPYILTQDNGVWISKCLANLEIVNLDENKAINLSTAKTIESNSYLNQLKQVFEVGAPNILLSTSLIFVSNRSALIKVAIQNKSEANTVNLSLKWKGNRLLNDASFKIADQAIQINFRKNNNVGWISTGVKQGVKYEANIENYSIQLPPISIPPKEMVESFLSQSFCFSEEERLAEVDLLNNIYNKGFDPYVENTNRWNKNLAAVLENIQPEFQTPSHQKIAVKCLQTLTTNWKSAAGALKHAGLFPSYNYEWFNGLWSWDSWKHAVAIAQYDTKLAQDQIKAMYGFQDEDGMIADCVYRDNVIEENNWRDTKPPLSAWAIWEVYGQSKDMDFLKEMYPKLEKYHNWWYRYRDINQNGICEYGSTDGTLLAAKWESGMDNAVRFDDVKIINNQSKGGSINSESVDLNAYLFAEKEYLSKICEALGLAEDSKKYLSEAAKIKRAIQSKFYNEELGWFFDYSLDTKKHIKIFGSEGWIPLWAKIATAEQAGRVKQTMMDTSKFATYIPFPTLAADHPNFKPQNGYWRGPVWLDQAYFAIKGLKNYGYKKEALEFSHQLFDRLEGLKNDDLPIRENYHTLTGEGLESNHFSWSAAHLLMLLTEE